LDNDQLAEHGNAPPIFSNNWTIKHQSHLVCKGGYGTVRMIDLLDFTAFKKIQNGLLVSVM
jgi:hypothetical protein